jgi:hypothetical protein
MFNVLLLPVFGRVEMNFKRNMVSIVISVLVMNVVGLYCNLMFETLVSKEAAYDVNSMFIIHSPFDSIEFLTYPIISGIALIMYFIIFISGEIINKRKNKSQ